MIYRAHIDLSFDDLKDANKAVEKALDVLPLARTLNPGQPDEAPGYITVEQCFHNEHPSQPCVVLSHHTTDI